MCFVLRAFGRRAAPDRAPERVVDIGRVIGRLVVEEEREGRRAGGEDARVERRDDRGAVLFVTDRRADERGGVRVDVELHVEDEAFAAEDDRHLHSVADPLSAGKVGLERATRRDRVRGIGGPSRRASKPFDREDPANQITPEVDVKVAMNVTAEIDEGAAPSPPSRDDGLDSRDVDVSVGILGLVRAGLFDGGLRRRRCHRHPQPVLHGAERDADGGGDRFDVEVGALHAEIEDEAPELLRVALALAAIDTARMTHHEVERGQGERLMIVRRRRRRFLLGASRSPNQRRREAEEARRELVRGAPLRARRGQDRVNRRCRQREALGDGGIMPSRT
jgi:hypothetical protein